MTSFEKVREEDLKKKCQFYHLMEGHLVFKSHPPLPFFPRRPSTLQATESATKDFVLAVLSEAALRCQSDLNN